MIDNEYIFELDIGIDLEHLKTKVANIDPNKAEFQQLIDQDPYLKNLKLAYPFLSPKFNIYFSDPKSEIPLHIDAKRNCALNIPLENTVDSHTIFYKFIEDPKLTYNSKWIFNEINSKVEETFRFTLMKPTLINNAVPHSVLNYGDKRRIVLSWSILPEYTFNEIKKCFQ
jgi:hypothetical protein